MSGDETKGIDLIHRYTDAIGKRFSSLIFSKIEGNDTNLEEKTKKTNVNSNSYYKIINKEHDNERINNNGDNNKNENKRVVVVSRSPSTAESDEMLLDLLLNEAQGNLRLNSKITDLTLSATEIRPLDARLRFRLGTFSSSRRLYVDFFVFILANIDVEYC